MRLYHRTFHSAAILAKGFKDAAGHYMTDREWSGVFFSAVPLDVNEGADGDILLTIEIPDAEIVDYEWVEEGKPYREWMLPAQLANRYGPPTIVVEDD